MNEEEFERRLKRVEHILDDNGRPGLVSQVKDHRSEFTTFVKLWQQREEDKKTFDARLEAEHKNLVETEAEKTKSIRGWIIALCAILSLVLLAGGTLIALLTYEHETHHVLLQRNSSAAQYSEMRSYR